ncbi:MAG TPA: crossover junction endodeoxyribonuclease RuvC [Candidatus Binatia bacterium]|nr:crossover junction endodeoxyribonuclease RuvC [Candidatus Binatia bacterium]
MRLLGVDPGLRTTGYGIVEADARTLRLIEAGVIEPDADLPLEGRLAQLYRAMHGIVAEARPEAMIVEELWTAYRNPSTAVLMGHARGVLYLAAAQHGVAVHHLGHSLVKRALVGSGAARKEQVKSMVMQVLGLTLRPEPDDVSDALALALAWAFRFIGAPAQPARPPTLRVGAPRPPAPSRSRRGAIPRGAPKEPWS